MNGAVEATNKNVKNDLNEDDGCRYCILFNLDSNVKTMPKYEKIQKRCKLQVSKLKKGNK